MAILKRLKECLEKDEEIFFNAGNHQQTVRMGYGEFNNLVKPEEAGLRDEGKRKAA